MFIWQPGDLNSEQEIVVRTDGDVYLTACPGSGKTRTLSYKIAYELSKIATHRQFIIALTYTNRAAEEICERIEMLGVDTTQLWISTIHSFCLEWIIKPYYIYSPYLQNGYRILNSHESEELITEICKNKFQNKINFYDCGYFFKNGNYYLSTQDTWKHASVRLVLDEYFLILKTKGCIDFEMMLLVSDQILENNVSICQVLSKMFPFILVDEFQDTKDIQYEIVSKIAKFSKNNSTKLFFVGDPNQAIFESLGGYAISCASLEALTHRKFIPMILDKNYRSSSKIIDYFSHYRVSGSNLVPSSRDAGYNSIISFDAVLNLQHLEDEIVKIIKFNIEKLNIPPNEICILGPWWNHLGSMTRALVNKLPEYSFDGPGQAPFSRDVENFWYKLAKIILSEPSPEIYLKRLRWAKDVIYHLDKVGVNTDKLTNKLFLKICNGIVNTNTDGLAYLRFSFSEIFKSINVDFTIYEELLNHYDSFFSSSISRIARLQKEGSALISTTEAFKKVFKQRSGVTISTIHGVKGAEFDTVICFALLDGMVPHFLDKNGDLSASKLLYVIGSRARKNLHLISEVGRKDGRGAPYIPTEKLLNYKFQYSSKLW